MVNLSSAESELHALVGGVCGGFFTRQCLKFLTGEEVQRVCLLDKCQITRKRGSGKLRHISGKLLRRQEIAVD